MEEPEEEHARADDEEGESAESEKLLPVGEG
jgi:hypothetical protein